MNIIPRGKYLLKVNIKDTRAKTVECHFKNRDTLSVNVFLLLSLGTWPQGTFKRKKLSRKKVLRSHDFQKSSRKFADTKHFDLYKLQKFILAKKRKILGSRKQKKYIYIHIYLIKLNNFCFFLLSHWLLLHFPIDVVLLWTCFWYCEYFAILSALFFPFLWLCWNCRFV